MVKVEKDSEWLKKSFINIQKRLELDLETAELSLKQHSPSQGLVSENSWVKVFRSYLPKRYEVSTGTIVDSEGSKSDQIDIIIYDQHFTPILLDQSGHQYIPIEAIYAIFESKQHIDKGHLIYSGDKARSVRKLKRTSIPIAHAGGQYPAKALFPIIAGVIGRKAKWTDGLGASFKKNLPKTGNQFLDCGCALENGAFDHFDKGLNIVGPQGALIYFMFRLLSKLQSLGTVPAIDWNAYAKVLQQNNNQ